MALRIAFDSLNCKSRHGQIYSGYIYLGINGVMQILDFCFFFISLLYFIPQASPLFVR
jgi:hypothetical protein